MQKIVKLPVFIITVLISYRFVYINSFVQLIVCIVLLILHYKLFTYWLNATYDAINKTEEKGNKVTKFNRFLSYLLTIVICTGTYFGIGFLINRFVFGMR
jgi:hypothetical protein